MVAQAGLFVARDSDGNGTTAKGARLALAGLLAKNADGTVKVGVLADGQGPVVTGAAGMSYNVRKHVAVTKASEANGPVLVANDGAVSVPTDPAPGSNSRIDVIYVWQKLVTGDGGTETTVAPVIDVAKGAAAPSPSVPAIPPGALELARVPVPAGTTATSGLTFTQGPRTAATTGTADTTSGLLWGVAYDPAVHTMKTHRVTVNGTTSSGSGDLNMVVDLNTLFKGVDSFVASNARLNASVTVAVGITSNTALVRCLASNTGSALLSYPLRINAIITGWI